MDLDFIFRLDIMILVLQRHKHVFGLVRCKILSRAEIQYSMRKTRYKNFGVEEIEIFEDGYNQ